MGLFDSLKSVVNMVTGGAATVTLEVAPPTPERIYAVKVKAVVDAADLKVEKVYLKIEGCESVTIRNHKEIGSNAQPRDLSNTEIIYNQEVTLAPAQTLAAKQTFEWTGNFQLPAGLPPTYKGKNASHVWRVYAGLDASGNDPKSDFVSFDYRP